VKASCSVYIEVGIYEKFREKYGEKASERVQNLMEDDLGTDNSKELKNDRYEEAFRSCSIKEQTEARLQYEFYKEVGKIPLLMTLAEYYVKHYLSGEKP